MHRLTSTALVALVLAAGCGDTNGGGDAGTIRDGSAGMDGSTNLDGSTTGDGSTANDGSTTPTDSGIGTWDGSTAGGIAPCQGHIYQCGNGLDDDHDGVGDSLDPDCLGPCDNTENGLWLGIPGGDSAPCSLDCYYDQDQGSGNDHCEWDARCDPLEPDPDPHCTYRDPPPPSASCPDPQAASCHEFCSRLTPNGCDCFGCCVRPSTADSDSPDYRFIGSVDPDTGTPTCTVDDFTSGAAGCHPCTPVGDCLNGCGRCELCLGRDASDLPSDCFPTPPPDGGTVTLPDGGTITPDGGTPIDVCSDPERQDCGVPGLPACPAGFFCVTGCCTYFG